MRLTFIAALLFAGFVSVGCSTAPSSAEDRASLERQAKETLAQFKSERPGYYKVYNDSSVGVAVFPSVGKGAVGVGGAYGKGVLMENGKVVGYCDLTQASIGLQLGGQAYAELIFFQNRASLGSFKNSELEFAAQASAVALKADASANANYTNGVAVFTIDGTGLMYEASIGGQRFTFLPKDTFD
ncbi:MAG: hypothetical protein ACE37H_00170 [Phycisphaeraceae bacterium]